MKNKKTVLSKRQRESMARNFSGMSVKKQRRYAPALIMMAVIVRTIKGKLGITLFTNDGTFLVKAKGIFSALTANTGGFYTPAFANLALINTQAIAFEDALDDLELGVLGAEGAKTEAKKALKITLDAALAYVNNIAFLTQSAAVEIITGANMEVITPGSINKQDFSVRQGAATGSVKLSSLAVKFENRYVDAFYEWQYSRDNGTTWLSLDSTTISRTVAQDMVTDVKTLFRKRTTSVKTGISAWSNPISIIPV